MRHRSALLWSGLVAALALGGAIDRWPLGDASARLERIPASGPGFVTRVAPVDAAERSVFGAATVYRRQIASREGAFTLTVIDGTRNRHALHDPHYCFNGAGYRIVRETRIPLPGGEACRTDLERAGTRRQILWYFSDGSRRHASPPRAWSDSVLRRLSLGASGPAPVLVLIEARGSQSLPERLWPRIPDMVFL